VFGGNRLVVAAELARRLLADDELVDIRDLEAGQRQIEQLAQIRKFKPSSSSSQAELSASLLSAIR
jgi:hypothetical protein